MSKRAHDLVQLGGEIHARQAVGEVDERPAEIAVDKVEDRSGGRRVPAQAEACINEQHGGICTGEEVLQVTVGDTEFFDPAPEFSVNRIEFLVDRSQLFLGGLQL